MSTEATQQPQLPDEVVTRALLRYIDLPLGAGTAALITLDNGHDHTRPNTFGPGGLASLDAALDEVSGAGDLAAVLLTGKPFVFAVGADLSGVAYVADLSQAMTLGAEGHRVFRRLGELAVPSFAFVNGAAMGGGLEIALHCTYRTISSGAAAVSLPECFLGLVPGWGGTQLLPNLIGADRAITVIIENPLNQNRQLKPRQVLELGIADAMFDPADFLEESIAWAAAVLTGARTVERAEVDRSEEAWATAVARGRAIADARSHGLAPAPYRALDLVTLARTASRDEGFAAEDAALADLVMGDELRAGLYAFDLVQKRAKRPAGAPDKALARPVTKVGDRRCRADGRPARPAVRAAARGARRHDRPRRGAGRAAGSPTCTARSTRCSPRSAISADRANRLKALVTGSTSKDGFADADWVIEAVFEELKVKQQVFAEVEAVVSPSCILATNTSSLSVSAMARACSTRSGSSASTSSTPSPSSRCSRSYAATAPTTRHWRPPSPWASS